MRINKKKRWRKTLLLIKVRQIIRKAFEEFAEYCKADTVNLITAASGVEYFGNQVSQFWLDEIEEMNKNENQTPPQESDYLRKPVKPKEIPYYLRHRKF